MSDNDPTDHDPTDHALTDQEERSLRDLLQRAADAVDVTTPTGPSAARGVAAAPRTRHRAVWAGLAAAAVVAVVAAGVVVTNHDDTDQIRTGGPDPQDQSSPTRPTVDTNDPDDVALAPIGSVDGIWRLPGLVGFTVESVEALRTFEMPQVAVDDPADPTRWIGLSVTFDRYDDFESLLPEGLTPSLNWAGDRSTGVIYQSQSDNASTYAQLLADDRAWTVEVAFNGPSEQEIVEVLDHLDSSIGAAPSREEFNAALAAVRLPAGLVPAWNPALVGVGDPTSTEPVQLSSTLQRADGSTVYVSSAYTGVAPEVASVAFAMFFPDMTAIDDAGTLELARGTDDRWIAVFGSDGVSTSVESSSMSRQAMLDLIGTERVLGLEGVKQYLAEFGATLGGESAADASSAEVEPGG